MRYLILFLVKILLCHFCAVICISSLNLFPSAYFLAFLFDEFIFLLIFFFFYAKIILGVSVILLSYRFYRRSSGRKTKRGDRTRPHKHARALEGRKDCTKAIIKKEQKILYDLGLRRQAGDAEQSERAQTIQNLNFVRTERSDSPFNCFGGVAPARPAPRGLSPGARIL